MYHCLSPELSFLAPHRADFQTRHFPDVVINWNDTYIHISQHIYAIKFIFRYGYPASIPVCLAQGSAVQELAGLPGEDCTKWGLLGTVQGLHTLLATNGTLVTYLLVDIWADQEPLWHFSFLDEQVSEALEGWIDGDRNSLSTYAFLVSRVRQRCNIRAQ